MSYEKASIYEQTISESWLDELDGDDSLADIEEDEMVCNNYYDTIISIFKAYNFAVCQLTLNLESYGRQILGLVI